MSATPIADRERPAETIAGFLATLAIFGGAIAVVERPVVIGLTALLVALIAAAMAAGRNRSLAAWAVALTGVWWLSGMIISVLTSRPLW